MKPGQLEITDETELPVGIASEEDLHIGHLAELGELLLQLVLSDVLRDVLDDQPGRHLHLIVICLRKFN